jgi:predicted DsbA family dithiol-disulfide isomerase
MKMKIEIYSDVACPWCYIGKHRFERALGAFPGRDDVEVVDRPFQLDPTTPTAATPLLPRLEQRFGAGFRAAAARTEQTAKGEGLTIDHARALAVNTLLAHRLMWLAERDFGAAVQRELAEGLFEAYFAKGGNVGDREQLTALAVAAGMDRDRVARFLASSEGEAEVRAEIAEAQAIGVDAVPTFVFDGKYAVAGAQPASVFLQVLERVASEEGGEGAGQDESSAGGAADACVDDSCAI